MTIYIEMDLALNNLKRLIWQKTNQPIYIYIYTATPGAKEVAVPPWATETVLSPWLAADEDRLSHVFSHVLW